MWHFIRAAALLLVQLRQSGWSGNGFGIFPPDPRSGCNSGKEMRVCTLEKDFRPTCEDPDRHLDHEPDPDNCATECACPYWKITHGPPYHPTKEKGRKRAGIWREEERRCIFYEECFPTPDPDPPDPVVCGRSINVRTANQWCNAEPSRRTNSEACEAAYAVDNVGNHLPCVHDAENEKCQVGEPYLDPCFACRNLDNKINVRTLSTPQWCNTDPDRRTSKVLCESYYAQNENEDPYPCVYQKKNGEYKCLAGDALEHDCS